MKAGRGYWNLARVVVLGGILIAVAGCGFFGKNKDEAFSGDPLAGMSSGTLGVNAYLWRATLDTLAFMPLASTDSSGGAIITDWFAPPDIAGERLKVDVYIMDLRLRADALRVSVFRQVEDENGVWRDGAVKAGTAKRLEDAILTRARQLRIRSIAGR